MGPVVVIVPPVAMFSLPTPAAAPPAEVEIYDCPAARDKLMVTSADVARVGCGDQRLGADRRQKGGENFRHDATLIDDIVHLARALEERRTGIVDGNASIAVNFCELATLDHDHHGTRMKVPSGRCSGLKDQVGLQHIGRSLQVQNHVVLRVGTLRQGLICSGVWLNASASSCRHGDF